MTCEIEGRIEGFAIDPDSGRVYVNLTTPDRSALPYLARVLGLEIHILFN